MKVRVQTILTTLILAAGSTHANVLMLDFGPTTAADIALTNSPAHSTGAVGGSLNTWNTVGTSASLTGSVSSLLYANGSAASGVSFTYGVTPLDSKVMDYTGTITSSNALGNSMQTGIYAGTSVAKDGIFSSGAGQNSDVSIGIRIDGLGVGDYSMFVMARNTNTNTSQDHSMNIFVNTGATSNSFDFSAETASLLQNTLIGNDPLAYDNWIADGNYVEVGFSILNAGDSVFLAVDGAPANQNRGFLNAVQVVPVPEPSTTAMLMSAICGVFICLRRRGTKAGK